MMFDYEHLLLHRLREAEVVRQAELRRRLRAGDGAEVPPPGGAKRVSGAPEEGHGTRRLGWSVRETADKTKEGAA